ncbi:MAG: DUF2085 domain-containing protein, partial [Chloroflexota bacterium]|nr:DUF2085 domain-containing protein [Chloroflexota bacterium]
MAAERAPRSAQPAWLVGARWLARHWLAAGDSFLFSFATLPVLAPLLAAAGWRPVAQEIFAAYGWVCHQMPSRSFFILGQQMAYCERNTAIYGSMAVAGLLWGRYGRKLTGLHPLLYGLLVMPMAVDGFTQLFGLRESTWQLRVLTGTLFGVASVWFALPIVRRYAELFEPLLAQ